MAKAFVGPPSFTQTSGTPAIFNGQQYVVYFAVNFDGPDGTESFRR